MKDWATTNNSILINPTGKEPAYDNIFFREGHVYNQGNIFNFNEEAFYQACEQAIKKLEGGINQEGIKAGKEFTYQKTTDSILKALE